MARTALSPSLAALLGAAAALVPDAHAQAASGAETDQHVSYRFNEYDEDPLAPGAFIGSPERYRVLSQQFELATRAGADAALDVTATHEIMSGSSPWYVLPGADGRPVQVLSRATIREHRSELRAAWTRGAGTESNTTFSASYSAERDYHATAVGVERSIPLGDALTLGLGGSFSHDLIAPVDAVKFDRIRHAGKNSASAFGSLAWVLDRASVLQTGIQFDVEHGFLSDPYKLVAVGEDILADARPDRRVAGAWLVRYRRAFADAALHLDYRYAQDSWGVVSHTVEAAWYQDLPRRWQLVPSLRWYGQQQARFYAPFFDATSAQAFHTSDYRLGTFGALSASLNLRKRVGAWEFSAGVERYHGARDYAPGGADGAVPGVVSFTRMFVGLDFLLQ